VPKIDYILLSAIRGASTEFCYTLAGVVIKIVVVRGSFKVLSFKI
jgi:hypothetical protein